MKKVLSFLMLVSCAMVANAQIKVDSVSGVHIGKWPYEKHETMVEGKLTLYGTVESQSSVLNMYCPVDNSMVVAGGDVGAPYFIQCVSGRKNGDGQDKPNIGIPTNDFSRTFYVTVGGVVYAKNGSIQQAVNPHKQSIYPPVDIQGSSMTKAKGNALSFSALSRLSGISSVEYFDQMHSDGSDVSTMSALNSAEGDAETRIGLTAEDVEMAVPQAVRTLEDGSKGIYYSDLVAVLIDAVNELNGEVESLKAQLASSQPMKVRGQNNVSTETTGAEITESSDAVAFLSQNNPNPFNTETVITYRLPDAAAAGSLRIYDLQGKQVKKFELNDLTGEVTIQASELEAGMYLYTLIADGSEVDTKRMVLTD